MVLHYLLLVHLGGGFAGTVFVVLVWTSLWGRAWRVTDLLYGLGSGGFVADEEIGGGRGWRSVGCGG
ncbi:hypothetical protein Tco_0264335 [Tanacetum coccineum]